MNESDIQQQLINETAREDFFRVIFCAVVLTVVATFLCAVALTGIDLIGWDF